MAADMELVSRASEALITAAATPGWDDAKQALTGLLGRYDRDLDRVRRRLDELHEEVRTATPPNQIRKLAALQIAWRTRLVDLLDEHPEAAEDLRGLLVTIATPHQAGDVPTRPRSSPGGSRPADDPGSVRHVIDDLDELGSRGDHIEHEDAAWDIAPGPGDPDLDL